jgi:hypothetical protein
MRFSRCGDLVEQLQAAELPQGIWAGLIAIA